MFARGDMLSHFDRALRVRAKAAYEHMGIEVHCASNITRVVKDPSTGKMTVHWDPCDCQTTVDGSTPTGVAEDPRDISDVDCVLFAIGRQPRE